MELDSYQSRTASLNNINKGVSAFSIPRIARSNPASLAKLFFISDVRHHFPSIFQGDFKPHDLARFQRHSGPFPMNGFRHRSICHANNSVALKGFARVYSNSTFEGNTDIAQGLNADPAGVVFGDQPVSALGGCSLWIRASQAQNRARPLRALRHEWSWNGPDWSVPPTY